MGGVADPQVFLAGLLARLNGPGAFRFILQPLVAVLLGIRDGMADARTGHPLYIWGLVLHTTTRWTLLRQGAIAIVKPFVIAMVTDVVLSWVSEGAIFPGQTLVVAICLIALPYTVAHAITNRLVCAHYRWRRRSGVGGDARRGRWG